MTSSTCLWSFPKLIVHRAGGFHAPENTRAAFLAAKRLGAAAVEIDVMLTADGVLVLSHDEELGRAIASQGRVAEMTASELRVCDAGVRFSERFAGESVFFFDEAVRLAEELNLWMNIEIKPAKGFEAQTAIALADALAVKMPSVVPLVSSFSETALSVFGESLFGVPRGFIYETTDCDWQQTARVLGVQTVHPHLELTTLESVAKAHESGWGVMSWCVDTQTEAEAVFAAGADAICTNCPEAIQLP